MIDVDEVRRALEAAQRHAANERNALKRMNLAIAERDRLEARVAELEGVVASMQGNAKLLRESWERDRAQLETVKGLLGRAAEWLSKWKLTPNLTKEMAAFLISKEGEK